MAGDQHLGDGHAAPAATERVAVVTGATGFLGRHLVLRLCGADADAGNGPDVPAYDIVLALGRNVGRGEALVNEVEATQRKREVDDPRIRFEPLDLASDGADWALVQALDQACHSCRRCDSGASRGLEAAATQANPRVEPEVVVDVFHSAALPSPWASRSSFVAANVIATNHVISFCESLSAGGSKSGDGALVTNLGRLVHVSTPSLYADGKDQVDISEDDPVAAVPINDYAATKGMAEKAVLASRLPAVAIRPRAIFGVGDTTLLPRLVDAARAGRLRVIGDGNNRQDLTHVDTVVDALIASAVAPASAVVGRAFNITNGEPVRLWAVIDLVCDALGVTPPLSSGKSPVPAWLARAIAGLMELVYRFLRTVGVSDAEPPLTRFAVYALSSTMTFDVSAAKEALSWAPRTDMATALAAYFRALGVDPGRVDQLNIRARL